MFRFFLVAVLGLVVGAAGNDQCTPWDDMMDDLVLDPARAQIEQATGGFISIPDYQENYGWGTHLTTQGGIVGNLSTIKLYRTAGDTAIMCQDGSNITIGLHVGLTDFETSFKDFKMKLPLLPTIGDTKTTIKNTGNGIALSISLINNGPSCKASLNYLNVLDYGTTTFHFENGIVNKIYQTLLSHGIEPLIKVLNTFGVLKKIDRSLETLAAQVVTQEGEKICKILSTVF